METRSDDRSESLPATTSQAGGNSEPDTIPKQWVPVLDLANECFFVLMALLACYSAINMGTDLLARHHHRGGHMGHTTNHLTLIFGVSCVASLALVAAIKSRKMPLLLQVAQAALIIVPGAVPCYVFFVFNFWL